MSSTTLSDAEIISHCLSGALIDDIDRFEMDGVEGSLINRCVSLHNAGEINLLALTKTTQFELLSASEFFVIQDFFCKAIPQLQVSMLPLMEAVKVLVVKGGADLMANRPYQAFRDWCAADRSRADAIISASESGDVQATEFVTFAFTALNDASLARSFVSQHSDERRLSAMFALGRIKPADVRDAEDSILVLLPFVVAAYDEATRYNALLSLLNILDQCIDLAAVYLPKAIVEATMSPTTGLQFNLAQALWSHIKLFDSFSIKYVLDALKTADLELGGTVAQIDQALKALLGTPNEGLALDFLTEILAQNEGFELEKLKSTKHELAGGNRDRLFKLIVRWLSDNSLNLGAAAQRIVTTGEHTLPFQNTTAECGLDGPGHIFLAHKTLGWLFLSDVVAASVLVACLRGCDRATSKIIGDLLFDPLLLNYGGKAREYLKTIKNGDEAYRPVKSALKAAAAYAKGLEINASIKELRPSEYQRSAERRHSHDLTRKIQKDAEKNSVFFNLVHRSVLLYGRRSITYVQEPGNKRRSVSMDLHSFSHSFELPRCEVIDPVGLSIMLFTLRSIRRK